MAYLALARKYRPQRFADMIGQEHVTRTLENAIRTDRVHHAYLFCGVRGLGKTTAARILAKALVCERGPTPEPCNECAQCVAVNQGRSVDVIEIDGASNNSVEDVRSLRDQVNYLPQTARRKIYIIDEVHMLTQQAFNALLKTLEEPPPHVTFMFATTDPHKVLPTILSRVSRLDYRRVRAATLAPYLEQILAREGFSVEAEGLNVIARCGEGSVRDSLTLLDKVIAFAQDPKAITTAEVLGVLGHAGRFAIAQLVQAVLERDTPQVLARFEEITSTGSDLMQLTVAILQHLRDLAVVKLTGSRAALLDMSDDLYAQLADQAKGVEATVIAQHFDRFARVIDNLENSRAPRLVVEMGLLELCTAEPLVPLGDLVARLDALGAGRGGGGGAGGGGGGGRARPPSRGRGRRADAEDRPAMRAGQPEFVRSNSPPAHVAEARREPVRDVAREPVREVAREPVREPVREREVAREVERAEPRPSEARPSPARSNPEEADIDMLEQLARDAGLLPGSGPPPARQARAPRPVEPAWQPEPQATPEPGPTPSSRGPEPGSEFALTNEALDPLRRSGDPEAGCPSSRCTPREPIAWRELDTWDAWESFLAKTREENDLLWAVLQDLGLVAIREGTVVLASPATGFAQTQLRENPELKTAFEHLTAVYFGEVMHLEVVDATPTLPDTPSLALVEDERERRHQAAITHDAEHNPRIRSVLSAFAGQMTSVEPLEGPALPPIGQRGLPDVRP
ncbi:DNA polymerase III subunit tau [Enhygromyxa salina]|uniref:DNA polymerase III subunit gamma/tau n=1 Tax=Enhygromyxa salina TaxID=215803 RepID=A0A2S9YEN7_9BACT|nr:DNA polymerase III subunit gamma/tau [Enhygromyxa salina]PRQ03577.1 DNA polymerase III subunit tau [Enhygromyxa salina]